MTAGLDPTLTFSTLVAGAANQLALAAARAAAESQRPPFNPLFLHGREGLGKTHLLHALGHRKLEVDPRATVRLIAWRAWSDGLRAATAAGRGREFLVPFAEAALLLLDDAHLLAEPGHPPELLEALVSRVERRLTTVLAGARAPADLFPPEHPAARLLGSGLVVELGAPDSAMRWDILHRRSEAAAVDLGDAVLEEVAALPFDTVQDLVGAANRLMAFQAVSPAPLDPAQARVLITGVLDTPAPDPGMHPAPAQPARTVEPRSAEDSDEFGSFLSDVVASVSRQVDEWRARIADAMLRWQGEGYQTARLEALLDQELPAQPDLVLERYESDIAALRRLRDELAELAPESADEDVFFDPDRLAAAEERVEQARTSEWTDHQPAPEFRLEDLIEGTSNRTVISAIRAVVTSAPGATPNPLLVVGGAGTGKTHLLHGLANALSDAGYRGVICVGAGRFAARRQEAAEAGRLAGWRRRFQWVTALLLDDVHHLAHHPDAQGELSELITAMLDAGRPVVFTSAVPMADLAGLTPTLLQVVASGASLDLPGPDREVRLGTVRQLLAATDAAGDAALADYLAARPADSVRAVQGIVQQVLRAASAAGGGATPALAREVLELAPGPRRAPPARPGIIGPSVIGVRLREKMIQTWPTVADRLIEDLR
jgi:chromosomal replication initiation ATPase DnaA